MDCVCACMSLCQLPTRGRRPTKRCLQGFGWAIAKSLAEAGAEVSLGVWVWFLCTAAALVVNITSRQ